MICGWQIGFQLKYCAERKADGLPMCEEHFDEVMAEYGSVHMAPGNALGAPQWAMRLLWEGVTLPCPWRPRRRSWSATRPS
jgi:hypothetical protein